MAHAGRKRKLTSDQLAVIRYRYETMPTSYEALAAEYGVSMSTMALYGQHGGWKKFGAVERVVLSEPLSPKAEFLGHGSAEELDAAVAAHAQATYEAVVADGLTKLDAADKAKKPAKKRVRVRKSRKAKAPSPPAIEVSSSGEAPDAGSPANPPAGPEALSQKVEIGRAPGASIIQFPGGHGPPPPRELPELFPQNRLEQAEIKGQLAELRGVMTVQQIARLKRHETMLANYRHLMDVYLSPQDFVDVKGLNEEEAQEKLARTQRAALSLLLPTERDTLAGAVKTLNHAFLSTIQMERLVAGLVVRSSKIMTSEPEDGEGESGIGDVGDLNVEQLRRVRGAMQVLTGERANAHEPPRPPEPESLDDLVVARPAPEDEIPPR